MAAHEIITIQAGKFANFVGAHWWNIQESSFVYSSDVSTTLDINHDVTFREGSNLRGETTYTPRLVLIDSQDNFRSLRKECSLYRDGSSNIVTNWDGPVQVKTEESVKKNSFLEPEITINADSGEVESSAFVDVSNFNDPSTSWSDFLKTNLHPNSLCLLNELYVGDVDPLEMYSSGEEIYHRNGEMFEESLRKMTEDCDHLQGFQFIFDAYNGFSGISGQFLQYLDDEYNKRPSLCFPVYQEDSELPLQDIKKQMHRLYAILLSMSNMNSYCTFFSPLSLTDDVMKLSYPFRKLPYVDYNEKLLYHTSAIYAAGIETLTSSFRLKSPKYDLHYTTNTMAEGGRKIGCSSICLPFPLARDSYLSAMVEKDVPEYYMTSLSPFYKPDSERTRIQYAVLRGLPGNRFQKPGKYYHSPSSDEVFGEYLNKYSPSSAALVTTFEEKCNVTFPFPNMFKSIASNFGCFDSAVTASKKDADKVPIAASFSSSDSATQLLEDVLSQANKFSFKEYVKCAESKFEKDTFPELIENLIGLQDNYIKSDSYLI